jgi:hypothetical protein
LWNTCHHKDKITFMPELLSQISGLAVHQLLNFLTSGPEVLINSRIANIMESQQCRLILPCIRPAVIVNNL